MSLIDKRELRMPQAWLGCDHETYERLNIFYERAYMYAKAAHWFLSRLVNLPPRQQVALWHGRTHQRSSAAQHSYSPIPAYWFGPYSKRRVHFILNIFRQVLQRFEQGYRFQDESHPVRFQCLTANARKCRTTVLANASQFGTIRICPRLLSKPLDIGGMVVLHEMLHQKLEVGDQRDSVCKRGDESRCYRRGARQLVKYDKLEKAIKNNDNYAFFARAAYLSMLAQRKAYSNR